MRLRILGIMIPIMIVVFSYGIVVGLYESFPYEELNQVKKTIFDENEFDVSKLQGKCDVILLAT